MRLTPECGLLNRLVDYAGLFPPARLELRQAASSYASYRLGQRAPMLGRFVVPVGQLAELVTVIRDVDPEGSPWEVSVLVGQDVAGGLQQITAVLAQDPGSPRLSVRSIEAIAEDPRAMGVTLPPKVEAYFEIDHRADPSEAIRAAAAAGVAAKIRTGGIESAAFPSSQEIARFILACGRYQVPFKATAGLHHPFPATYPLTYEEGSPVGAMHGFMNVFFAAGLAWHGLRDAETLCSVLESTDRPIWDGESQELCWMGRCLSMAELGESRCRFARSYGSCSFIEPIEGLEEAALL